MIVDRSGQTWEETYGDGSSTLFVVLGRGVGGRAHCYRLLDLETGEEDHIAAHALDTSNQRWRRLC